MLEYLFRFEWLEGSKYRSRFWEFARSYDKMSHFASPMRQSCMRLLHWLICYDQSTHIDQYSMSGDNHDYWILRTTAHVVNNFKKQNICRHIWTWKCPVVIYRYLYLIRLYTGCFRGRLYARFNHRGPAPHICRARTLTLLLLLLLWHQSTRYPLQSLVLFLRNLFGHLWFLLYVFFHWSDKIN